MKSTGKLIFMACLVTFVGCSAGNKAMQMQFLELPEENARYAEGWKADEHGLQLATEIFPLNRKTAFLFGALLGPGASVQSVLLRSGDGGRNWKEAMTPVAGSQVIKVSFRNKNTGWALVGWTVEGPGKLSLYKTEDSGESWKRISSIPKRHHSGWPMSFGFVDERNGRIGMLYDAAAPTDGFVTMTTSDGGLTWGESRNISLDEYRERYGEKKDEVPDYVTAEDGSQWKLESLSGEQIGVLMRRRSKDEWSTRSVIPSHFGYSAGRIILNPQQ